MRNLIVKLESKLLHFFGKVSLSSLKSFSKFYGNFAMGFFNNQIGINSFQEFKNFWSRTFPNIANFSVSKFNATGRIHNIGIPSKFFQKPINKAFVGTCQINSEVKLPPSFRINFTNPDFNTAFTIDNAGGIG